MAFVAIKLHLFHVVCSLCTVAWWDDSVSSKGIVVIFYFIKVTWEKTDSYWLHGVYKLAVDSPGHRWPLGHYIPQILHQVHHLQLQVLQLFAHPECLWCGAGQGSNSDPQPHSQVFTSSNVESWSFWQRWVGDIYLSQLWQDSILFWSFMGDTEREVWEDDSLNVSCGDASLCDFPLWIFKPFTVLKFASHWSHWKSSFCFIDFW